MIGFASVPAGLINRVLELLVRGDRLWVKTICYLVRNTLMYHLCWGYFITVWHSVEECGIMSDKSRIRVESIVQRELPLMEDSINASLCASHYAGLAD